MEYPDGDTVWVKLGPCWWPGEVWGPDRIPPGIAKSFRKPPIAVVKFFQEDSFEYVKNGAHIFKYDCPRKREFIKKGLDLHRAKHSNMEKFPEDVSTAENRTDGDPDIVKDEEFAPQKKESYAGLFTSSETPSSAKKSPHGRRGRPSVSASKNKSDGYTTPKITHPRIIQKLSGGSSDYRARILVQPNEKETSPEDREKSTDEEPGGRPAATAPSPATPVSRSSADAYSCCSCNFTTNRLNTLVLHNKSHSAGFIPHTPPSTAKSSSHKTKSKSVSSYNSDDNLYSSEPVRTKKRKLTVKTDSKSRAKPKKLTDHVSTSPLKNQNKDQPSVKRKPAKTKERESKKPKSEAEIKDSLLADWNEDSDDESMDILSSLKLAENPANAEKNKDTSKVVSEHTEEDTTNNDTPNKQGKVDCFDFEEEEDLQIENIGKKIPRTVGKPEEISKKSVEPSNEPPKAESKVENEIATSENAIEEDSIKTQKEIAEFDSAVNNLLEETAMPDLPPLLGDPNLQKSKAFSSPEKNAEPPKSIFKTKTFFRSRHSRSQDAIEKYVADNTSCDKYMEESSEPEKCNTSSDLVTALQDTLDESDASTTERVVKCAPKIQLKKMSAALSKMKDSKDENVTDDTKYSSSENASDHSEKTNLILNETLANSELEKDLELTKNSEVGQNESSDADKPKSQLKIISTKIINPQGKEKILNFDVQSKISSPPQKQKIIIRRTVKPSKSELDNYELNKLGGQDNLVLTKSKLSDDDVQTFTIEDSGVNPEPKIKKVIINRPRYPSKPHNTIITSTGEIIQGSQDDYDINSMPIVLSDDIIASDSKSNVQKVENIPKRNVEVKKSIIVKSIVEKSASPNILSKSKVKGVKQFVAIDQATGERKFLVGHEGESILASSSGKKTQKIILNPGTKGNINTITEAELGQLLSSGQIPKSKPSAGKVGQNKSVMIITNSQGGQSKILLSPEHQKLLFPKSKVTSTTVSSSSKGNSSMSMAGRIKNIQTVVSTNQILNSELSGMSRGVTKHKNAILNSKGQIILSGNGNKRTILTTMPGQAILTSKGQLIAPQSSIVTSTAGKLLSSTVKSNLLLSPSRQIKTAQKTPTGKSTMIFKSHAAKAAFTKDSSLLKGTTQKTVMHYLTPSEYEHFQKTGEIISSRSKIAAAGKSSQEYILQKYVGAKHMMETVPPKGENRTIETAAPPLVHTTPNKSKTVKKQQEIISKDSIDSNDYDESLIPATIIRTRKGDAEPRDELKEEVVNQQSETDSMVAQPEYVPEKTDTFQDGQTLETETALADAQKQLLAIPGENFGGPPNTFFLCVQENGTLTPVDNQPLVLENNQLVPMPQPTESPLETTTTLLDSESKLLKSSEQPADQQVLEVPVDASQQHILINIGDQQILVDQQTLLSLVTGDGQQLVTSDGQSLVFQGNPQQILAALASNPEVASLLAGNQQLLLNAEQTGVTNDQTPSGTDSFEFQTEVSSNVNQDILAAALAGTEVYSQDSIIQDSINVATTVTDSVLMDIDSLSPNLQNLNTSHSSVFETSSTLNQPIMSPLEIPTKKRADDTSGANLNNSQLTPKNLEDSLADIGVSAANVPTSLELPITVTNPRIAGKTTSPLSLSCGSIYQSSGLLNTMVSPGSAGLYDSDMSLSSRPDNLPLPKNVTSPAKELNEEIISAEETVLENRDSCTAESSTNIPSMPSLDENNSDVNSVSNQVNDVQTKTYSPISMPILTEDSFEVTNVSDNAQITSDNAVSDETNSQEDSNTEHQDNSDLKSMPMLMNAEEQIISESVDPIAEEISENVLDVDQENILEEVEQKKNETESVEDTVNSEAEITENSVMESNGPLEEETIVPVDNEVAAVLDENLQNDFTSHEEVSENCLSNDIVAENTVESEIPIENNIDSKENDEICADTPPHITEQESSIIYDDEIVHNEPDGNSLPDHESNVSCSSESAALPDSTSPNVEAVANPHIQQDGLLFSESSSDASAEIPMQPSISVSQHLVQDFSSILNKAEEKPDEEEGVAAPEKEENSDDR